MNYEQQAQKFVEDCVEEGITDFTLSKVIHLTDYATYPTLVEFIRHFVQGMTFMLPSRETAYIAYIDSHPHKWKITTSPPTTPPAEFSRPPLRRL